MSGKLPSNMLTSVLTRGILEKYPNLEKINEHSHDIDNEESLGYSQ